MLHSTESLSCDSLGVLLAVRETHGSLEQLKNSIEDAAKNTPFRMYYTLKGEHNNVLFKAGHVGEIVIYCKTLACSIISYLSFGMRIVI